MTNKFPVRLTLSRDTVPEQRTAAYVFSKNSELLVSTTKAIPESYICKSEANDIAGMYLNSLNRREYREKNK